jgi:hypothetical protein
MNGAAFQALAANQSAPENAMETWPPSALVALQGEIANALVALHEHQKLVDAEVSRRFAIRAESALKGLGKWDGGSTQLAIEDGCVIKASRSKTTSYDSDALMKVASTMAWDRAQAIFTIRFGVSETIYKGLKAADPDLASRVEAARTVKTGDLKLTITTAKE